MKYDSLLIHYGELSTKGNNRKLFIGQLGANIKHALKGYSDISINKSRDFCEVFFGNNNPDEIAARLQEVSGIQRISLVAKTARDISELKKDVLELIKLEEGKTFKIETKRSDKTYPLDSYHTCIEIADYILDNTSLTVDLHNPDIVVNVNIRKDGTYVFVKEYPGSGGYPLGMNGKVMLLLSGGIDSPVAAYSLLKRGIKIECIHFAAPPYTSARVLDKLNDILAKLNYYQESICLNVVPFTKLQEAIYANVAEPYCITIMRRMMLRIATELAKRRNCLALATGESIGQVASQTLESINTINDVTNFPILRPLATFDKLEIIKIAKKIDTFDISIRPYEDCCTIFKPKAPKTKPKIKECEFYESKFDWKPLVDECVESIERTYKTEE